jgi:sigma-54 specific flagellar transcriptional regulator A
MTIHTTLPFQMIDPRLDAMLVGNSAVMTQLKQMMTAIAASDAAVLVTGPTGTGKDVVARGLHLLSDRKGAFVAVNCGAIPHDLIEAELFGHEKGAFTGAQGQRIGLLEQADGGTLFLDEIGEMPLNVQVKLLRALETRSVQRVGGGAPVKVDFRLVSATHRDLKADVAAGRFRADLLFRIEVFGLTVPSLAARREDIAPILAMMAQNGPKLMLSEPAMAALMAYDWPGNVRELRNFHDRAQVLFGKSLMDATAVAMALTPHLSAPAAAMPDLDDTNSHDLRALLAERKSLDAKAMLRKVEARLIDAALDLAGGCVTEAARMLRLKRTTLIGRMQVLGLGQGAA